LLHSTLIFLFLKGHIMKLVNFLHEGRTQYGAVKDSRIVNLSSRLGSEYSDIVSFIAGDALPKARAIVESQPGDHDYDAVELLPVVPNPGKIICVGVNYDDHLEEARRHFAEKAEKDGRPMPRPPQPGYPMIFARWAESLTAHRAPILRPKVSTQLDWEAELLVVIGKPTGRYVKEENALDSIFGYSCMNEACLRDYQFHTGQINPGKNFEKTGATGPWLVTADEVPNPQALDIELLLNGKRMQFGNTRDMTNSIAKTIAYITQWIPLQPGDLIATGTMGGVGFTRKPPIFMKAGDVAEVIIQGIGTLRNEIKDEPTTL
jgi:2-keto-4-pentenoate hydratase/2-oxohepta-3-ene-1,7-dioic acid hydratase in catechol pathway